MKRCIYITIGIILTLFLFGCKETTLLHPYGENDGIAPAPVTDIEVRNFAGGALLRYKLPKDLDLAYVRAFYKDTKGNDAAVTASAYVDSMRIEGFGDTNEYRVEIRAFDKFQNASEPVFVDIKPETPPVQKVFESLTYTVDFGGFVVDFVNEDKAKVGIYVTRKDTLSNTQEFYDVYFTEKASGSYSVRGLPDDENEFCLYVKDKWENMSEVKSFTATPMREDELDKAKFSEVNGTLVPGDVTKEQFYDGNSYLDHLWNGQAGNWDYCNTLLSLPFPHLFTIDLGVVAKISRMKIWQRDGSETRWKHAMWKEFSIYGCKELPDRNIAQFDPLAGWDLLGEFESIKPSGLPLGQENDEDIALIAEGEEFQMLRSAPPIRYFKIVVYSAHSPMQSSGMSEISIWGQVEDDDPDNLK